MITAEQIEMPSWPRRTGQQPAEQRAATGQHQLPGGRCTEGADREEHDGGPVEGAVPGAATEHHRSEGDHCGRVDRGHGDQRAVGAQRGQSTRP